MAVGYSGLELLLTDRWQDPKDRTSNCLDIKQQLKLNCGGVYKVYHQNEDASTSASYYSDKEKYTIVYQEYNRWRRLAS